MRRIFITLLSYLVVWLCRQVSADDLPVDLVPAFYNRCIVTAQRIFFIVQSFPRQPTSWKFAEQLLVSQPPPWTLFPGETVRTDCIYRRKLF